jgi:hypothetical protein
MKRNLLKGEKMLAQIVLTPTESKRLIAKAISQIDAVKKAAAEGMIVMHPSSSTYFLVEEITGEKPKTDYWVCGSITPKGMCQEMGTLSLLSREHPDNIKLDPGTFPYSWVIRNGKVSSGEKLSTLLEQMGPKDVYVKGVNALDPQGNVGVLVGHPTGAGTIGLVMAARRKRLFTLIFAVGLEKLIPIPMHEAAIAAKRIGCNYAMGMVVGLIPCKGGRKVTEVDAIEILSGSAAIPIAGGGLGGAEGSIALVIKGNDKQVKKAIGYAEQSKGARLPQFRLRSCYDCPNVNCRFPVGDKPWAT